MNDFQRALERGCAAVGLAPDGARLLRLGSNAVYHLKAPVIVRVSRPGTDVAPARRSVAVARWLESEDYPAVRAIDVVQPVIADGYVVTHERTGAWIRRDRQRLHTRGVVVSAGALGTNKLLFTCKLRGSLPNLSDRLGYLVEHERQ